MRGQQNGGRGQNASFSKFTTRMQKKLVVLFILIVLAFVGLGARLAMINKEDGEQYKKQVLSQQQYDSRTIPYRRGDIMDSKGTMLAVSEKVYNVILDSYQVLQDEKYLEPTIRALKSQFDIDEEKIRQYIAANPGSRYYILARRKTFDEISGFKELQEGTEDQEEPPNIQGVWFEEEYIRRYPNGRMACDAVGFTTKDNRGTYGLEEYYNDVLSGTPGREYGYLNSDAALERTTIAAVDGNSIVTTIDANIQSIVEKHLKKFDEEYRNNAHEGNGARNMGCIVMDVHSGEILAMANYPSYDLNDTKNVENLIGMRMVDEVGNPTKEEAYITAEGVEAMDENMLYQQYNALWKNFCISDTFEPGSVAKPFTVAAALECGSIRGDEVYQCNGVREIGGHKIHCHNRFGDGPMSVTDAVARSCNMAMTYIGEAMGVHNFVKWQHIFNFGLKTNIDLAGEGRTAGLIYDENGMGPTELATNTFGQGFNATMIEMVTGFCSLINGGYYYEPHMVSRIVSPGGATVQNIEPRILRQTVSASTSEKIVNYCNEVVSQEKGTGRTARPAGYRIGGKTGTAETLPRKNNEYIVSFMGYAPADEPQVVVYVVVDRPNVAYQDDAKYATRIVRGIMTEMLPYMGIFMTEELSDEEREELSALQLEITTPANSVSGNELDPGEGQETENAAEDDGTQEDGEAEKGPNEIWKTFPIDQATGYAVDPNTGDYIDPVTGATIGGSFIDDGGGEGTEEGGEEGENQTSEGQPAE